MSYKLNKHNIGTQFPTQDIRLGDTVIVIFTSGSPSFRSFKRVPYTVNEMHIKLNAHHNEVVLCAKKEGKYPLKLSVPISLLTKNITESFYEYHYFC